jgi:Domain of unknown function (DUF4188)
MLHKLIDRDKLPSAPAVLVALRDLANAAEGLTVRGRRVVPEGNGDFRRGIVVKIQTGRYTADVDDGFVVFLIGMRFNKPLKVHKWLPVVRAMPRMIRVLDEHPELGCLGHHQWVGRTTIMLQYWRDFDALDRFARDGELPHLEPWRAFNRAIRDSGDVGIWHETYRVRPGEYEAVYGNMPVFGLAAATRHVLVSQKGHTAAARIGSRPADVAPVEPY